MVESVTPSVNPSSLLANNAFLHFSSTTSTAAASSFPSSSMHRCGAPRPRSSAPSHQDTEAQGHGWRHAARGRAGEAPRGRRADPRGLGRRYLPLARRQPLSQSLLYVKQRYLLKPSLRRLHSLQKTECEAQIRLHMTLHR
jgi:hypothetical protein